MYTCTFTPLLCALVGVLVSQKQVQSQLTQGSVVESPLCPKAGRFEMKGKQIAGGCSMKGRAQDSVYLCNTNNKLPLMRTAKLEKPFVSQTFHFQAAYFYTTYV